MAIRFTEGGLQSFDPRAVPPPFSRKKKPPSKAPPKEEEPPIVFRDVESGLPTGVRLPDGKVLLGLSSEEIERMTGEAKAKGVPFLEAEEVKEKRAAEAAALGVGEIELTGDVMKDILSYEQAIKSALATAGAGAVGAGAVGALAGGPIGAAIGAGVGAVGGFLTGFKGNLQVQRKDMLKGESQNLMKAEQNMLKLIMETNKFGNYPVTLTYFNSQMSLVSENYDRLQQETSDDLSLWLGEDGHKQLEKYETFYSVGGMRDILTLQMQNAISNPDPSNNAFNALIQTQLDASEKELAALEEE